jgi:hypothetical protein
VNEGGFHLVFVSNCCPKTQADPELGLLFNCAALASILFILSMTLIPILERLFLRDLIRRGEQDRRKVEALR